MNLKCATHIGDDTPNPSAFYHVHSFAQRVADPADVVGTATYGGPFATAVARGSLFGVQFHPEKSGPAGLRLLRNFAAVCERSAAGGAVPAA